MKDYNRILNRFVESIFMSLIITIIEAPFLLKIIYSTIVGFLLRLIGSDLSYGHYINL